MEILSYTLTACLMFASVFIGIALAKIAKDEVKQGKKYIAVFQKILLFLIFFFAIVFSESMIARILIGVVLIYLFSSKFSFNDIIAYCSFGLIYALFSANYIILALIFLHGFPAGTLLAEKCKTSSVQNAVSRYIWIIPVAVLLFLVI